HLRSLLFNIEQNVRWSREWLVWRVCDDTQRQQWNAVSCTGARNEFCFHVHSRGSGFARNSLSLFAGIDQGRQRQQIGSTNRQARQRYLRLFQVNCRKILREQKIVHLQLLVERPCESGADQKIEMLVLEKSCQSLPTNLLAHASMKNFNLAIMYFATNCPESIPIGTGFTL